MAQNRELSYCKIVEAIAETTVPLTPMGELLAKIPSKRAYISKAKVFFCPSFFSVVSIKR